MKKPCVLCKDSGKLQVKSGDITCICKEDKIPGAVKKLMLATYDIGVLDGADKLLTAVIAAFKAIKKYEDIS